MEESTEQATEQPVSTSDKTDRMADVLMGGEGNETNERGTGRDNSTFSGRQDNHQDTEEENGRSDGTSGTEHTMDTTGNPKGQSGFQGRSQQELESFDREITSAVQQLTQLFETHQISREQYQQAMQQAGQMKMGLREQSLANREQSVNNQKRRGQYNDKLAETIPGWSNENTRKNIQDEMVKYYCEETGCSPEEARRLGDYVPRGQIEYVYKQMKAKQLRNRPKIKPHKRKQAKPVQRDLSNTPTGRSNQTSAIADLLQKVGVA